MDAQQNLIRQFNALPEEWRAWLEENFERGCNPVELANILLREGLITLEADETFTGPQESLTGIARPAESTVHFSIEQKKWLAQAVLEKKPQIDIYQTLQAQGLSEKSISQELVQLKQDPYFQIAQQQHFLVKKRNWLLDTLDRFARLNPEYQQIARIQVPSFDFFIQHYYSRNLPVILTHAVDHWSALKSWSPAYFQQVVGDQEIEVQFNREQDPLFERNSIRHKTKMTMRDYVDLVTQTDHSNNFYMTANNAKASQSSLAKLFRDIGHFHGYTDHTQMTDRSFIWFGPKGAFTPLHHDLTNNVLVQVYGRKKVTLIPALQVAHLYNDVAVFSKIADPHAANLVESFPEFAQSSRIECVLNEGEALFIPLGWWHCVESLDVSISVSFTHFNIDNAGAETFPSSV
ncbi:MULTISPECIES: cupin-like domain-containing protein [unclassified Acinetobacter]|uniref:cupin-like domain-containing protein n=1 Tax=unclassified Acinetobacter TaxID=196816 RepID=UPI00244D7359|nr:MULTISPECIES: cupin-like domain-containing protein [unclassified Acinetobacter]MDH0031090.1 cupin-like domain-containing protein [Acinetobacter sp. GD04021]MDH0886676.1 cupin-like domain-containing protein [Acinetobacter sp. GD03873]MDH1083191.1 cupin-like domain-containing protein [Acinetobacter sp. GD03983]MDH2189296.1 cupin-like domain-containing protein [Acinetobacter sp. GD03645]MDH2202897.1 cupin-like domain-containing protein [Acinetobacter sp. GD03647]